MKRGLKIVAWVVGVVVVVVVAAVVLVPLFFDPNDYKDELAGIVRERTGRDLNIQGDLDLSVFPWLGVHTGALSLSNPEGFDEGPMVSVEEADVRMRLLPLLSKRVEVDTISLRSPRVHLIKTESGATNWEDLAAGGAPEDGSQAAEPDAEPGTGPAAALGALAVQGVRLDNGEVVWEDRAAGELYRVGNLEVSTGEISGNKPVPLDVSFDMQVPQLPEPVSTRLTGEVAADAGANRVQVRELVLTMDSSFAQQPLKARLAVPEASMDGASGRLAATGVDVNVVHGEDSATLRAPQLEFQTGQNVVSMSDVQLEGAMQDMGGAATLASLRFDAAGGQLSARELKADVKAGERSGTLSAPSIDADIEKQTLAIPQLTASGLGVTATASVDGTDIIDKPAFTGRLEVPAFDLRAVLRELDVALETADPDVLASAAASAGFQAGLDQASLDGITLRLDDTTVTGSAGISGFSAPAYRFDLELDAIDLDRYLPPESAGGDDAAQEPAASPAQALALPVAALQGLDVEGKLAAGRVTVAGITLSNLSIGIGASEGNVQVKPLAANALDGTLDASASVTAGEEQSAVMKLDHHARDMQIGPLLEAAGVTDRFSGRGDLQVSLATRGAQGEELLQQLDGNAGFHLRDGAIRGFNLRKIVLEAKRLVAQYKGEEITTEADPADETRFTELLGTVSIADGVATSNDLSLKSPLFRVTGEGKADLPAQSIDYLLNVTIVATAEGQGGAELAELSGVTVPVRIQGPFADPKYRLDVAELARSRVEQKVEEEKQELKQKLEDKLRDKLKEKLPGLLGN